MSSAAIPGRTPGYCPLQRGVRRRVTVVLRLGRLRGGRTLEGAATERAFGHPSAGQYDQRVATLLGGLLLESVKKLRWRSRIRRRNRPVGDADADHAKVLATR